MVLSSAVTLPPPRSLNKFMISPSLWSFPSVSHLKTRIISNLLYFQTNYFLFNLVCFVPFVIMSLKTVVMGAICLAIMAVAILFFREYLPQAREIKQNHPTLVIVGGLLVVILGWRSFHTLLLMAAGLLAPTPVWFLHAALRLSDRLTDSGERTVYAQTPLGRLMKLCYIEPKVVDHEG